MIQTSWSGEEFELKDSQGPRLDMRGWVTNEGAKRLAELGGKSIDELRQAAESATLPRYRWAFACRSS